MVEVVPVIELGGNANTIKMLVALLGVFFVSCFFFVSQTHAPLGFVYIPARYIECFVLFLYAHDMISWTFMEAACGCMV